MSTTRVITTNIPIKNVYIEKFYVCRNCKRLFKAFSVGIMSIRCDDCGYVGINTGFKTIYRLKPKYQSWEGVGWILMRFSLETNPLIIYRGALKQLYDVVVAYERELISLKIPRPNDVRLL